MRLFLLHALFISYFLEIFQLFAVFNFGFTPSRSILLIIYLFIIVQTIWEGKEIIIAKNYTLFALLCLWIACLLSGFTPLIKGEAPQIVQYIKTISHLSFWILTPLLILSMNITTKEWTKVIKTWLFISIFINIFGIYQVPARAFDLPLGWIKVTNVSYAARGAIQDFDLFAQGSWEVANLFRATSIFSEPSYLAGYNLITFIFFIIPFINKSERFFKNVFLNFIIIFFCLLGLLLTFSMTAFTGIFLILATVIFIDKKITFLNFFKFLIIGVIVLFVADRIIYEYSDISVLEVFQQRFLGIIYRDSGGFMHTEGESFEGRLGNAFQTISIWMKYPINGIGFGLIVYNPETNIIYSDYAFLSYLAETGILGGLSFLAIFFFLFYYTLPFVRKFKVQSNLNPDLQRLLPITFYLTVYLVLINFVTGNHFSAPYFWLIFNLIISIVSIYSLETGATSYKIKLVSQPLKERFAAVTKAYINNKIIKE